MVLTLTMLLSEVCFKPELRHAGYLLDARSAFGKYGKCLRLWRVSFSKLGDIVSPCQLRYANALCPLQCLVALIVADCSVHAILEACRISLVVLPL